MKQTQLSQQNRPKIKLIKEICDANGKLLIRVSKEIPHLLWNRMTEIKNSETGKGIAYFIYDHNGNRVYKETYDIDDEENNLSTYYIRGQGVEFVHNRLTNGTIYNQTYLYLQDKLVAKIDNDGNEFFYHPDHLGSTTLVTNETGDVVEDISYLPFGDLLREMTGAEQQRFLYTGQEYDRESELLYYGARYYKPEFRRFLAPDSVKPNIYNPQALNSYSYTYNNPYSYKDDSGNIPILVTAGVGVVAGGISGFALTAYQTYQTTGQVDFAASGKAAAVGAVAGGVSGLTLGVGTALLGTGTVATLGIGAGSSVLGGQTGQLTENLISGVDSTTGLFETQDIISDAVLGVLAGAGTHAGGQQAKTLLKGGGNSFTYTNEFIEGTGAGLSSNLELDLKKLVNEELLNNFNNQYTPLPQINEEGKGSQNNYDSFSSGGGFGSSAPPPGGNICQISFACGYSGGGL
jgi:RHS repeat-associated protein